ncbi:hypothetical protein BH09VER1_BH09VER1_48540 [soil metagenome]
MTPDSSAEIRDLSRGVRAISCAFALVICYFNAFLTFKISTIGFVFSDMLGGKPLPFITDVIFQGRIGFIALSLGLPLVALLSVIFIRPHRVALSVVGGVLLVAFIQMHFTWIALTAPLVSIISGMSVDK